MGKKKAKKQVDDDWEAEFEAATNGTVDQNDEPSKVQQESAPAPEPEPEPEAEPEAEPDASDEKTNIDEGEPEIRILTKAEKEKIKKEKEKAKKAAKKQRQKEQAAREKAKAEAAAAEGAGPSEGGDEAPKEEEPTVTENTATAENNNADNDEGADEGEGEEGDEETSSSKKKKKKKKKGAAVEEKPKKKGTAMGAMLKARLAEQAAAEKALREEEARLQAIADAEAAAKEEAERIEREKKEAKKERERQKKAEKRAAGTLLTKAQREKQRLAALKRKQMEEAGLLMVPGDSEPKKVSYSKKKKPDAKTKKELEEEEAAKKAQEEEEARLAEEAAKEREEEKEDIKEEWDMSSEDEEEEETKKADAEQEAKKKEEEAAAKKAKEQEEAAAKKAKEEAEAAAQLDDGSANADYGGVGVGELRSPICCVLGHVDTGKTKILDKIRKTTVQDGEAGGITQQIGASFFPVSELKKQTARIKGVETFEWNVPGLLIMDTPGHESFSNLRNRGSSLCNLAVLVVDIMHGLEPQTIESINLLKKRKTPFIVALNKVDRLHDWKPTPNGPIQNCLKKQKTHTKEQFQVLSERAKLALNEQGFNCELYYENKDFKKTLSIVPTSAHTGEGIPDLLYLIIKLTQGVLAEQIRFTGNLNCTVLEVKKIDGHGTTIDAILADGTVREGDKIVLAGLEGPIITTIRSLLMPEPLKELRVKNAYRKFSSVSAANGVKIAAKDMEKAVAGMKLQVVETQEEAEEVAEELEKELEQTLKSMKTVESGVHVQASTLGSLEALLEFLRVSKIPVSGLSIGPVHKKDIVRASIQLERDRKFALVLAFDVPVEREAEQHAKALGIKIFTANIIYHLFDSFTKHIEEEKARLRAQYAPIAIFPCELKIIPDAVFNTRDPIVCGVNILDGILKVGTKLCTGKGPDWCELGVVTSIEFDHKPLEIAIPGQEVCIKIDPMGGDKKLLGRHFDVTDKLISHISRESIDAVKAYFKEDLKKSDWKLMLKLKNLFEII